MVRFLIKLGFFLPLLLAMAVVNSVVDPAMFFGEHLGDPSRHRYEATIASDLLAGKPHSMVAMYNERIVDELIFKNRPEIDTLAIGSSIAKPINSEVLGSSTFFNASIYGGRLEEAVAACEVARESGLHLRRVVLQFDGGYLGSRRYPVLGQFSQHFDRARHRLRLSDEPSAPKILWDRFVSLLLPQERQATTVGMERGWLHPIDLLISPRYLQLSVKSLDRIWSLREEKKVVKQFEPQDRHLIFADGSVQWAARWRARTVEELHKGSPPVLIGTIEAETVRPLTGECRLFEAFVLDLVQSGIEVEIVLVPPNPWLARYAENEFKKAGKSLPSAETETYVRSFADRHPIRVRGSFDPRQTILSEADFVDYWHTRREAIGRLWEHVPAKSVTSGDR